jgi:hypothetical protein
VESKKWLAEMAESWVAKSVTEKLWGARGASNGWRVIGDELGEPAGSERMPLGKVVDSWKQKG